MAWEQIVLGLYAGCVYACLAIAESKGHPRILGCFLGIVLGPLGLLAVIRLSSRIPERKTIPSSEIEPRVSLAHLQAEQEARSAELLAAYERYANPIVAEIDLKNGSMDQLRELGLSLKTWNDEHPEISEIQGLQELLAGNYPPYVPSGPMWFGIGMDPSIDRPVIVRTADSVVATSRWTKRMLVQSLKAQVPMDAVHGIHVGKAFRPD